MLAFSIRTAHETLVVIGSIVQYLSLFAFRFSMSAAEEEHELSGEMHEQYLECWAPVFSVAPRMVIFVSLYIFGGVLKIVSQDTGSVWR